MATQEAITQDTTTDFTAGAQLIRQLKEYWEINPVQINDETLWDMFRAVDKHTWRNLIEAVAELLREGYAHPVWKTELCAVTLKQLLQDTRSPLWPVVMSRDFKGKSHPFKTNVWKVARISVEIAAAHCDA
jgi:hypothetical protein